MVKDYGLFSYIPMMLRKNLAVPRWFGQRGLNGGVAMAFGRYLKAIGVDHVREFGCGVGTTTLAIRKAGISVTGYDIS